ncbi:MAG: sigma-70 family RNA polymerase sigma factor [Candidatus Eisenbacteria bacterium]
MTTSFPQVPETALDSTLALVTRARGGDRAALELIADRYQSALARFAHGRMPVSARSLFDTDDLVQMAVVRTLAHLDHIDATNSGSLLAYLRRAVLNQIRDELRRAQRRALREGMPPERPVADLDPLEQVISREQRERYEEALAQLPAEQQEAFMMRIEMDCSYREIAEALGKPSAEAARMLVRRAIQSLARLLKRVLVA